MKPTLSAFSLLFLLTAASCVEEGHSPDCGAGGRANYEEAKCLTPIGGSCLTHDEFVKDRPEDEDADPPQDPEEDWILYMAERPHCDFAEDGGSGNKK